MDDLKILQTFQKSLQDANQERQKLEKVRKQAFQVIAETTKSAKSELDNQCVVLLQKQKLIDENIKKVSQNQALMQKQVQQWTEMIKKFNDVLKELGDATQTANVILDDLKFIQTKMK